MTSNSSTSIAENLISMGLRWSKEKMEILDQTRLPHEEVWIDVQSIDQMVTIIQKLQVRGAPLIGVSAVLCLASALQRGLAMYEFESAAMKLRAARPTAVNLMNAIDNMLKKWKEDVGQQELVNEAIRQFHEDVELCEKMANNGGKLLPEGGILTHCNTGGLATVGRGTALGVIQKAHELGKKIHVFVDETRPLNQGSRLTTWELNKLGIPYTLICDNMAATLMREGKIQAAITGSDRIATNGDFANKIGTYGVAALCSLHHIPFFVAAPRTTVDVNCHHGDDIEIEQRSADEVRTTIALKTAPVWNPAFDVTPAKMVSHWILDTGAYQIMDIEKGVLR